MLKTDIVSFKNTAIAFSSKSDKALKKSYRLFKLINNVMLLNPGITLVKLALALRLPITGIIKKTIFKQFCGGETLAECQSVIDDLAKKKCKSGTRFFCGGCL